MKHAVQITLATDVSKSDVYSCVCLKLTVETAEQIELIWELPSTCSYTLLGGNLDISKNEGTSLWNFVLNSRLSNICFGISIMEVCY